MAKRKYRGPRGERPISLAIQNAHVQHRFSNFVCQLRNGKARWRGTLQPRLASPSYHIEIRYWLMDIPRVRVLAPPIASHAPHLYKDGSLCLYWPAEWRWHQHTLIAETIIPWTAAWLYYYELWLDTGKWLGPSSHDHQP